MKPFTEFGDIEQEAIRAWARSVRVLGWSWSQIYETLENQLGVKATKTAVRRWVDDEFRRRWNKKLCTKRRKRRKADAAYRAKVNAKARARSAKKRQLAKLA